MELCLVVHICKKRRLGIRLLFDFIYRKDVSMRIGIDIGGSHVGVGLINKRNDIKHRRKKSNKRR